MTTRCLQETTIDPKFQIEDYQSARDAVNTDFYIDDLLTGANTFEKALKPRNNIIEITESACLKLRKWASNDERLINDLGDSSDDKFIKLDLGDDVGVLGTTWKPKSDTISYSINRDLLDIKQFRKKKNSDL